MAEPSCETKKRYICFLDMDGLIADFISGACAVHGVANPYMYIPPGDYRDLADLLQMSPERFWGPLSGAKFWADLPKTPDADKILTIVKWYVDVKDIGVLSYPARNTDCVRGKTLWLERHMPELANRYVYTPNKYFCAAQNHILIDDFSKNTTEFNQAGGQAFLYPRLWNELHSRASSALSCLNTYLADVTQKPLRSLPA